MSKIIYQVNSTPFLGENQEYHYLYRIINLSNMMEYTGVHSTKNLDDGYSGSGKRLKRAQKKYGMGIFIKLIDEFFYREKEMYLMESQVVNKDYISKKNNYNLKIGGLGSGNFGYRHTKETIEKLKKSSSGRKHTIPSIKIMSDIKKKLWKDDNFKNKMNIIFSSENFKNKISKNSKLLWRSEEFKKKQILSRSKIFSTAEYRKKLSESHKKKVLCIENNKIFNSAIEAALFYDKNDHGVINAIRKNGTCAGFHWKYIGS